MEPEKTITETDVVDGAVDDDAGTEGELDNASLSSTTADCDSESGEPGEEPIEVPDARPVDEPGDEAFACEDFAVDSPPGVSSEEPLVSDGPESEEVDWSDEDGERLLQEVADVSEPSRIGPWVLSLSFTAAVFLLASGAVPLGPLSGLPYGRVGLAGLLALLFAATVRIRLRDARTRQATASLEETRALLARMVRGESLELEEGHPLRAEFTEVQDSIAARVKELETSVKKQARVELVRARSECERLVEKHCEQTQESKRRSQTELLDERKAREIERREWESARQIHEAAQRDAEERIAVLTEEAARLEGEVACRDESIAADEEEIGRLVARVEALVGDLDGARAEVAARDEQLGLLSSNVECNETNLTRLEEELEAVREEEHALRDQHKHFLDTLASNLRGPLQTASHLAETLVQDVDTGDPETAEQLGQRATRLSRLADQVLDLCRIEAGSGKHVYSEVQLERLVGGVISDLRPQAESRGIDLSCEVGKGLPPVSLERSVFVKILRELVSNGIRFCERGTRVWAKAALVTSGEEADVVSAPRIELEVGDSGEGIPLERQEQVFGLFQKAGGAIATAEASCGLGLSLVQGFVRTLEGDVELRSEPGQGCVFLVRIPARVAGSGPKY